MPVAESLYMVLAALSFSGLDLTRKLLAGRIDALALVLFLSLGAVPIVGVLLAVNGIGTVSTAYLVPGLGALTLNFLANLAFIYSVKFSPLSRTIPLLSLTPAFTVLTAIPLLGEFPDRRQTAGILLVVLGAMALNAKGSLTGALRGMVEDKGALLMTAVAMMWSISGPLDKQAIAHASVYFHATAMTLGVGLGAFAVLLLQGRLETLRKGASQVRLLVAAMFCVSFALVFQLLAIRGILVSLVEAFKRAVGSLMAVVLGRLVFQERVRAREWVSVLVMIVGVFLLLT